MAHFAKLDANNVVEQVIVVSNDDIKDNSGTEVESIGVAFCQKLLGASTNWKQTSYNNNFRKQYAGIGYRYDASKNKFITPQPYASWSLDASDDWQAPITYPSVTDDGADPSVWRYLISWNETKYQADNTKGWEATKSNDESETPTVYDWNGTAWVSE